MNTTKVQDCGATDCAFNEEASCHAVAITIDHHECGTYAPDQDKGGVEVVEASVGACKASDCTNNRNLMCQMPKVHIGSHNGEVSCMTYHSA